MIDLITAVNINYEYLAAVENQKNLTLTYFFNLRNELEADDIESSAETENLLGDTTNRTSEYEAEIFSNVSVRS